MLSSQQVEEVAGQSLADGVGRPVPFELASMPSAAIAVERLGQAIETDLTGAS